MNKHITIEHNAGNTYIGDSPESKVDSAINTLLNEIAKQKYDFRIIKRKPTSETVIKIRHNNLGSKNHIIKQYLDHSSRIEASLKDIDKVIPFGKDIVLQNLNDLYFSALDSLEIEYFSDEEIDIEKIREFSEYIIDFIVQKLKNAAYESNNTPNLKEQIDLGVNVIVAYAFIECIIMKNPNA